MTDSNQNWVAESVWNWGNGKAGSGGIGLATEIPVWQMGLDMTSNSGSSFWRNIPDVALTADNIYTIYNGQDILEAGTSCAAPLWAGFTALVNQQATQQGGSPVGFLNPAIYSLCRGTNYSALFHDIITGNNTNFASPTNYPAAPGYDLCTGWGTPAGTNLINALTTPDPLGLLPQTTFITSGRVGGPFSQTNWIITVTNAGTASLDWVLGNVPAWLAVSASGGTLAAGGATNLTVQWPGLDTFPAGDYHAILMFTNVAMSRIQNILIEAEVSQSIVLNGGFETGDFTDWTLTGDTITVHVVSNIVTNDTTYAGVVHSGYYGALLGQSGYAATLSQTIATQPGQTYLVSFWLDNLVTSGAQTFNVFWNGTNLINLASPPVFTWSNFQAAAVAIDTNTLLTFAVENDGNYFGLDDVTVSPIPAAVVDGYSISTNGVQLSWPSQAGLIYQVQYTTDLSQGPWTVLDTVTATTNTTSFVDPNWMNNPDQGYYRLVLMP